MFVNTCCPWPTDAADVVVVDVGVAVAAVDMAELAVAAATWVGDVDDAVGGVLEAAGVGAASRRMNIAKLVTSDA
jgi:hypothetical protein